MGDRGWAPVFALAERAERRTHGALARLIRVVVHWGFRAPVLSTVQAVAILMVAGSPGAAGGPAGGSCRFGEAGGPPGPLLVGGAATAVASMILEAVVVLAVIVRERSTGHSPGVRSGQVGARLGCG